MSTVAVLAAGCLCRSPASHFIILKSIKWSSNYLSRCLRICNSYCCLTPLVQLQRTYSTSKMASHGNEYPLLLKMVASSVCIANRAASIVRDIMKAGDLGIKDKAWQYVTLYYS